MKNLPDPINQFNRLIHVSGVTPTGSYALGSRWNNMHNGQNWDGRNCTAAMGAVLIDAHTAGKIKSNPAQIRNAQYDWSGGIGWDDVNVATSRLWGKTFSLPNDYSWADVMAVVRNDRFVGIQGDNDQMGVYSCQAGGTFDHAYGIGGYRSSDGRILLYDPLCHHARWIPQYPMRKAAEKLAIAQRGSAGRLFVAVTNVMPQLPTDGTTYRYGGEPRFRGRYLARRDNVPVRSGPGTSYGSSMDLDHRESFACAQSVQNGRWLGTKDGRKWVYREVMWYAGGTTGTETVR